MSFRWTACVCLYSPCRKSKDKSVRHSDSKLGGWERRSRPSAQCPPLFHLVSFSTSVPGKIRKTLQCRYALYISSRKELLSTSLALLLLLTRFSRPFALSWKTCSLPMDRQLSGR